MRARLVPTAALAAALIAATAAGCGTAPEEPPTPASPSASPSAVDPDFSTAGPGRSVRTSTGWEITVYYTAVEDFHDGEPADVTGCLRLNCTHGQDDLGSYPSDFVKAVHDEGTGRTATGRYLNWSYDIGYWLDSAPRTSDGKPLVPFGSAAADPGVLPEGTRFKIADCGRQDDGSTPAAAVCAALRDAAWQVTDEFTPGLGGPRHIDAYIGPETGTGFTDSDWYITLTGARLTLG